MRQLKLHLHPLGLLGTGRQLLRLSQRSAVAGAAQL